MAGLPRHISQHVGGMIVSSRPLVEIVPLEPAAWEGRVLCQWDKDSCDDAGFIKIDFLALGMLSLVEETVDLIAERHGEAPDLSRIDFDDEVLYDRICSGDTVGLFQVESRAQIQMLRRTRPRNLDDLAVQVAIVRPGPIVGGAVNPYVRRREMLRETPGYEVPYPHPLLEEALGETLGVIIFQDQVLKVCQALASFSDGQAESLRRAMSRKRSKEALAAHWEAFREGALANGVDETTAREIFAQVTAFSEFGFPKSHASAFALLAYQSAWLRHYYPVEFYVGLFNNQPMGFYSLDALGRDARRNGIKTLLPDVNRSDVACTAEREDLRIGLGFVRGWGSEIAETGRRGARAARSLPVSRRLPAPHAGHAQASGRGKPHLGRRIPGIRAHSPGAPLAGRSLARSRNGRGALGRPGRTTPRPSLRSRTRTPRLSFPDLGPDGPDDRRVPDAALQRRAASAHAPRRALCPPVPSPRTGFPHLRQGSTVRVAGLVTTRQRPGTAKGYVFVLMEDEHGPVNVIVKPDVYKRDRSAVRMEPFLTVRGRLQKDGATLNVIAHEVEALRVPGRPVRRRGLSRTYAASRTGVDPTGTPDSESRRGRATAVRESPDGPESFSEGFAELQGSLPDTMEYWADPERASPGAFRYLTALRQSPPGIKSFG